MSRPVPGVSKRNTSVRASVRGQGDLVNFSGRSTSVVRGVVRSADARAAIREPLGLRGEKSSDCPSGAHARHEVTPLVVIRSVNPVNTSTDQRSPSRVFAKEPSSPTTTREPEGAKRRNK